MATYCPSIMTTTLRERSRPPNLCSDLLFNERVNFVSNINKISIFCIKYYLNINSFNLFLILKLGESWEQLNGLGSSKKKHFLGLSNILPLPSSSSPNKNRLSIGLPEDFRQVSSIIDVDIVPDTCRRVRLVKHGSDKPLGFYIRDGTSVRVTPHGLEKVAGIFISRLVPGGLAESTGLLAVNDEVLEVNGIEVHGKTLDQVTDMMVANSSNLIITIRPANQRNIPLTATRGSYYRSSQLSQGSSHNSALSASDDDEDEIRDHLALNNNNSSGKSDVINDNDIVTL